MRGRRFWHIGRTLLLIAVVAITFSGLMSTPPGSPVSVAMAGVAAGNDNKDKDNDKDDATNDDSEDRVLSGQVIYLYPDRNPPEMVVGVLRENISVRVLKTDEIALNGVKVGDHVTLQGEYNRGVFETTHIDVDDRCC